MTSPFTPELSRVWFRTVQKQHRLRIGADLADFVSWLHPIPKSPKKCSAWIGSFRQLQIAPELPHIEARKNLSGSLAAKPALVHESGSDWVAFSRYAATTWEVSC